MLVQLFGPGLERNLARLLAGADVAQQQGDFELVVLENILHRELDPVAAPPCSMRE